jgi:hypothetical protein
MNIAKALKLKNTIAKNIKQLHERLSENNSVIKGNHRSYDPKKILTDIVVMENSLIELKAKIQKANIPVNELIFRQAELKGRIALLNNLCTSSGMTKDNKYSDSMVERETYFDRKTVDTFIDDLQKEIDDIQDSLDMFNNTTNI